MTVLQNFYEETITASLSTGTVKMYVSGKPIADATSGWVVINPGNASRREIVAFDAIGTDGSGDFIELSERGVGGTTEQTHEVGEPVRLNITAEHWKDLVDLVDAAIPDSFIDTDGTLAADSDEKIPSQKAIKTYSDNTKIAIEGNQDVNGVKTFSESPIVPEPTTDSQAATKKYADDIAVAGAPNAGLTTKGLVQQATQAEIDAKTDVGDTGAKLFIVPSKLPSSISVEQFDADGTWTKPAGAKQIHIRVWGGGGSGAFFFNNNAAGGGGGGYSEVILDAASVGSTEAITVGQGGASVTTGTGLAGGDSSFGSLVEAFGGTGANGTTAGVGGNSLSTLLPTNSAYQGGGVGVSSIFGGGGGRSFSAGAGANSIFGGGGGGGSTGGTSLYGGNGGRGGTSPEAGQVPGGGGGARTTAGASGAGGNGRVIVTTF